MPAYEPADLEFVAWAVLLPITLALAAIWLAHDPQFRHWVDFQVWRWKRR